MDASHPIASSSQRAAGSMKKYIDWAMVWARDASAPAGLRGVAAAVVLVISTNVILLGLRYIQERPPVSITFILSVLLAAIRWGMLAGTVTAIGGGRDSCGRKVLNL